MGTFLHPIRGDFHEVKPCDWFNIEKPDRAQFSELEVGPAFGIFPAQEQVRAFDSERARKRGHYGVLLRICECRGSHRDCSTSHVFELLSHCSLLQSWQI